MEIPLTETDFVIFFHFSNFVAHHSIKLISGMCYNALQTRAICFEMYASKRLQRQLIVLVRVGPATVVKFIKQKKIRKNLNILN